MTMDGRCINGCNDIYSSYAHGSKGLAVVAKANVVDITLGCTYATGALTGGTTYSSAGLEIDWANDVKFTPLLGGESVDITNRNLSGKVKLDLSAAQEVALYAAIKANTLIATSSSTRVKPRVCRVGRVCRLLPAISCVPSRW